MTRHKRSSVTVRPPQNLEKAYTELLAALARADTEALIKARHTGLSHEQTIDLREAGQVLERYPRLAQYLQTQKQRDKPDLQLRAPTGSTPQAAPIASGWSGTKDVPNGVQNARRLRELAENDPWVRAAINVRRQQIGRADIDVVPMDPLRPWNKAIQRRLKRLLDEPNEMRDSYRSLIEPVLEDILVLDRGVLTKSMTPDRKPTGLYYEDGSTIKIYADWDGNPNHYRYLYEPLTQTAKSVPLRNDECVVFIANAASHRFGLSPVQVLYDTIMADLAAAKSGKNMVDMKAPPHLINIVGATPTQLANLRASYEAELMGRKEMWFLGGSQEAKVTSLVSSARDNQWLEYQIFLLRKIAAVFQVSPQQLGVTFDINKSTGEVQQGIFEDTGLIPLLLLLEEQLNRELLADFAPRLDGDRADLDALNLRIVYPEVSETARQIHAERASDIGVKGLQGLPSMTINQVLAMRGEQPVPGGNTFYANTHVGPVPFLSYDGGDTGDYTPPDLAGAQGSQDPASGTGSSATPKKVKPQSNVKPPPATTTTQKTYDLRRPGKKWTTLCLRGE